jgi:hypothetical protein
MELKLNKTLLLAVLLFVALLLGFVLRNFPFSGGNFDSSRTPIMTSTDVAYFTWRAESSFVSEMPAMDPSYTTDGVENVISGYPALVNTFMASFSKLTLANPYQVAFILVCLLSALVPLYGFIIVRRYFGTEPALIVLMLAMFASATIIFPIYLGFWADIYSYTPAIAALFFIKELWTKRRIMPLLIFAALSSAGLVGHAFEFVYAMYAIGLTGLVIIFSKPETRKLAIRNLLIVILLIAAFSSIFFIRFDFTSLFTNPNTFKLGVVRSGPPSYFRTITLSPAFYIGTAIGALAIIYLTLKRKYGLTHWAIISYTILMVLLYLTRFIGIEANQVYRQNYHSYWLLILPLSLGIFAVANIAREKLKNKLIVTGVLFLVLIVISSLTYASSFKDMAAISLSTQTKTSEWDSLMWLRDNTTQSSKILVFFGFYEQGFEIHSERMSTPYPNDETLLQQVCNGTMPTEYNTGFRYYMFSNKGRFEILNPDFSTTYLYHNVSTAPRKLTDFDYVLARYKGTQVDPCVQFYVGQLINQGNVVVWYDDSVVILKVNKNGA